MYSGWVGLEGGRHLSNFIFAEGKGHGAGGTFNLHDGFPFCDWYTAPVYQFSPPTWSILPRKASCILKYDSTAKRSKNLTPSRKRGKMQHFCKKHAAFCKKGRKRPVVFVKKPLGFFAALPLCVKRVLAVESNTLFPCQNKKPRPERRGFCAEKFCANCPAHAVLGGCYFGSCSFSVLKTAK